MQDAEGVLPEGSRRRSPTRSRTWTSRRRIGSSCTPTTCRSAPTGKRCAARTWCRSSHRRIRCSGSWAPSCATRPRRGPASVSSRRRRWSNLALTLPTEWSRPKISIDSGSWTQEPKSPLHQLSRHYTMTKDNHFILSSLMTSAIELVAAANANVSSENNRARGASAGADTPRAQLNFCI